MEYRLYPNLPQTTQRATEFRWLYLAFGICLVSILLFSLVQLQFSPFFVTGSMVGILLTGLAIVFGSELSLEKLSTAHMVGMFAFLISPPEAFGLLTLSLFIGGGAGIAVEHAVHQRHLKNVFQVRTLFIVSKIVISFWLASLVYMAMGLQLPIQPGSLRAFSEFLGLTTYAFVYLGIYFVIFAVQLRVLYPEQFRSALGEDFLRIAAILILPVPIIVVGAEIFTLVGLSSQLTLMLSLTIIIFAMHALTRSEGRIRRQYRDLQTVTAITDAMRNQLDLQQVMMTMFRQISQITSTGYVLIGLDEVTSNHLRIFRVDNTQVELTYKVIGSVQLLLDEVIKTGLIHTKDRQNSLFPLVNTDKDPVREGNHYDWISLPLTINAGTIGALAIPLEQGISNTIFLENLRLLRVVAASSAIAMWNAQLYQRQSDRAGQLVTLNRIGSLLTGTLSPDLVLDTVISSASILSQANAFVVHLFWNEPTSVLSTKRMAGFVDESEESLPPILTPLVNEYIDFNTDDEDFEGSEPIVISDVASDERTLENLDYFRRQNINSLVEMPLEMGTKTFGVIGFYYNKGRAFTSDEIEVLKTFATQAAQAINNAQVYTTTDEAFQRSIEQLLTLANIGRVLTSSLELEKICELVLANLVVVTRIHAGVVILKDFTTNKPRIMAQTGYDEPLNDPEILMKHGILGHVQDSGAPWRIEDAAFEPEYSSVLAGSVSQLAAPIMMNYEMRGVILVESKQARAFSDEDVYFVTQVANQAVIAIENARLFNNIVEGRDRLQVLLDAMEEGIILVDYEGKVTLANPRMDLIGMDPQNLIGRPLQDLLRDSQLRFAEAAGFSSIEAGVHFLESLQDDEAQIPINYVLRRPDNSLTHIRRQSVPIHDQNQKVMGHLLVFYNKTQEEELAKTREDMARMIVHDLRSPLTAVTTSLKLLQDYVPKDAEYFSLVQSLTDTSRRAIRKLLGRVDSILDIAKMQSGQLVLEKDVVELRTLASSVKQELEPLAKEISIQIKIDIPDTLPSLYVDTDKVERVLLNLVDNATKYSPTNSSVIILAEVSESSRDASSLAEVQVKVLDRGPGIPDDYKDHLFDQFVQVDGRKKVRRGVGLGLTFCRLVIEAHGGKIWIEDREGGGSAFVFTLPMVSETNR
jgi:two-component system, NtrC family, sensor histidine kinase KinB